MEDQSNSSVPTEPAWSWGRNNHHYGTRLTSSPMTGGHFLFPGAPGATASVLAWDIQPDTMLPDQHHQTYQAR